MKASTYRFRVHEEDPHTNLTLTPEGLLVDKGQGIFLRPYSEIKKVRLAYHPDNENHTSYSCRLSCDKAEYLEICNSENGGYGKFIADLHQYLLPYTANITFKRSMALSQWHGSPIIFLKAILLLAVMVVFSPIIFFALVISIPFWGPAAIAAVVEGSNWIGRSLRFKNNLYDPASLPDLQLPLADRAAAHLAPMEV